MNPRPRLSSDAHILGQLLLMQSVLCGLPDERSIFGFTCRGLSLLPGVSSVRHNATAPERTANGVLRFPVSGATVSWGEFVVEVKSHDAFAPHEPYVRNFAATVALILDERAQRNLNIRHNAELEAKVRERTAQLTAEIAERRTVEAQLQRSRDMLASTLDSVPHGIFWKDAAGHYLGCNLMFAGVAGFTNTDEIIGKTDEELPWRPEDIPGYRADDHEVLTTRLPKRRVLEQVRRHDGTVRWMETTKVPLLDGGGKAYAVLGVFEDVTDRLAAEKERESLQTQLAQAQKMESVGRLAGGVAHDFNNMLQAILGNAGLALLHPGLAPELREHLDEIRKAAERSAALTQQLLAFARKQSVSPRVLDLNETVEGVLKMLKRLIGENVRLDWVPAPVPCPVEIDPAQVDQILTNLAVNARDAIGANGAITITTGNASISADTPLDIAPGEYATLTVSDTGPGLSPEAQQHLFEPFFTTKPVGRGTGLGLATVYGIVKQNHGAIEVHSQPQQGSSFILYFPRSKSAVTTPTPSAPVQVRTGSETILLVEDEEQILSLAEVILKHQGYVVVTASEPSAALKAAREHKGRIDLLITDVIMPGMNGSELLAALRATEPGLRCLFISGYTADVVSAAKGLKEGTGFLAKPFTAQDLMTRVRDLIEAPPV